MESINALVADWGGPGLLVISFLAATLLPFSSEAGVVGALALGLDPISVLIWASVGNCLGVTLNYVLGRWGSEHVIDRSLNSRAGRRALAWSERYGKWGLLLSWLPLIGDPLTLAAGILRVNAAFFAAVAFPVRVFRYALIVVLM